NRTPVACAAAHSPAGPTSASIATTDEASITIWVAEPLTGGPRLLRRGSRRDPVVCPWLRPERARGRSPGPATGETPSRRTGAAGTPEGSDRTGQHALPARRAPQRVRCGS